MKLKTMYSKVGKLENDAYIAVCLLIKDILIKNNIAKWTCYFSGVSTDGDTIYVEDMPQEIFNLIDEFEEHFKMFDPQLLFEGDKIYSANYKFP